MSTSAPLPSPSRGPEEPWTEERAREGLAIRHYAFKWNAAQRLGHSAEFYRGDYEGYSYWKRVRTLFLELGGCWIDQLPAYQQQAYLHPEAVPCESREFEPRDWRLEPLLTKEDLAYVAEMSIVPSPEMQASLRRKWAADLERDFDRGLHLARPSVTRRWCS